MPTQDNDAMMIRKMGNTITDLQVKYRASSLSDQAILITPLNEMIRDYGIYLARLLKSGTITTQSELDEMEQIKDSITNKAKLQVLLLAISRIVALIAST